MWYFNRNSILTLGVKNNLIRLGPINSMESILKTSLDPINSISFNAVSEMISNVWNRNEIAQCIQTYLSLSVPIQFLSHLPFIIKDHRFKLMFFYLFWNLLPYLYFLILSVSINVYPLSYHINHFLSLLQSTIITLICFYPILPFV